MSGAEDEDEFYETELARAQRGEQSVLIIDDAPEVRLMLRMAFQQDDRFGDVAEAEDGREGLRVAEELSPASIVVDQEMPYFSGLELLPLLRSSCPLARIVMFSSDGEMMSQAALSAGADAYCVKGTPLSQVVDAVAQSLDLP